MPATATLRHFNRTYTQRIGLLEESFLGMGMPLAAARLVFEIGPTGTTVISAGFCEPLRTAGW
jgi:hypothetical protein